MKKLLIVLLTLLALVVLAPGQANAYLNYGSVHVIVDGRLSQSNMLFSFESNISNQIFQSLVAEDACGGESGSGAYECTVASYAEPQNGWVNPGWCAGFRDQVSTTYGTQWGDWRYVRGGYNGVSVVLNPSKQFGNMPTGAVLRIHAYLVPVGVAGCTY